MFDSCSWRKDGVNVSSHLTWESLTPSGQEVVALPWVYIDLSDNYNFFLPFPFQVGVIFSFHTFRQCRRLCLQWIPVTRLPESPWLTFSCSNDDNKNHRPLTRKKCISSVILKTWGSWLITCRVRLMSSLSAQHAWSQHRGEARAWEKKRPSSGSLGHTDVLLCTGENSLAGFTEKPPRTSAFGFLSLFKYAVRAAGFIFHTRSRLVFVWTLWVGGNRPAEPFSGWVTPTSSTFHPRWISVVVVLYMENIVWLRVIKTPVRFYL